jgi:hypothetical protein
MALDTVDGLFDRVQKNLGRGAHTTIVSLIPEWVNLIQRKISKDGHWWFCFNESTSLTIAQSADTITLPTDFLDEEYVFLEDSDEQIHRIDPMEYMEYRQTYTDETGSSFESRPLHYLLRETDLLFRPIADATYTLLMGYWQQLADLTAGGATNELLDTYPDVLETGATYKGFEYMQEYDDAAFWLKRHEQEFSKMRIANAEREFPSEFVLNVRPGQRSTRLSRNVRRNFF